MFNAEGSMFTLRLEYEHRTFNIEPPTSNVVVHRFYYYRNVSSLRLQSGAELSTATARGAGGLGGSWAYNRADHFADDASGESGGLVDGV
jgi:hypothetical protein